MKYMKRNWFKTLVLSIIAMFTLQSCAALFQQQTSPLMQIHQGQTKEEVFGLLGKPSFRRFNKEQEEWEYRHWNNDSSCKVTIITFVNQLVKKLDSFYVKPERQIIQHEPPRVIERPVYPSRDDRYYRPRYIGQRHTISDGDFDRIIRDDFRGALFTDDYLKKIRFYSRTTAFSCRQVKRLLKFFTFSDDKLKALRIVAPYIPDRINYRIILSQFGHFDKEKAMEILGYEDSSESSVTDILGF